MHDTRLQHRLSQLKKSLIISLGNLPVPVVYMGDKQGFADELVSNRIDLKSPGLAYLEA